MSKTIELDNGKYVIIYDETNSHLDYSELVFEISEEKIDNLVKEMVGEEK